MIDYNKPIVDEKGEPLKILISGLHHCIRCVKISRSLNKLGYTIYGSGQKDVYGADGSG